METTKKNVENVESVNAVKNSKTEEKKVLVVQVPPTDKAEKKPKAEKSDAVKKAEELQKEMERKQKELAEFLKVLEQKKDLSAKRTTFLNTLEQIDTAEDVLKEDNTFEVSSYRLIFALGASSYNNNEIFKISNRELLLNFVDFIREKINKKIAEIEAELIK